MVTALGTPPSASPRVASPAAEEADGYLLLTIQHAVVKQVYDEEVMVLARGEMRLECVSLPIPPEIGKQTANPFSPSPSDPPVPTHDFWLVLRVSTFEMPLIPTQVLTPLQSAEGVAYSVPSPSIPNASLQLILPRPGSAADMEDLDSLEVLLKQYKSLDPEATALSGLDANSLGNGQGVAPDDLRGRLVLINEDNGEVVGELDQQLDVQEDARVGRDAQNKPVILDFGNVIDGYAPKVKIQTVPEDEMDDWMLRGAHNLSKGILGFSSWSSRMMYNSADLFIKHTTPNKEPVKFGKNTKAGFRMAHNASVRTVNVTKSTVGMINNAISGVVEKGFEKGNNLYNDVKTEFNTPPRTPAPSLPPRSGTTPVPAGQYKSVGGSGSNTPTQGIPYGARRRPPPPPTGAEKPSLPPRTASPDHIGEKIPVPTQTETLLAQEQAHGLPPAYEEKQGGSDYQWPRRAGTSGTSTPPTKRPFLNRLLLAGEVVLTSLEATAHDLINSGTAAASSAAGHKFGAEAGHATALVGGSVRNVAVVYIDVRGVGRRALLKSTAKGFVKTRLKNGETVRLQGAESGGAAGEVGVGEVEMEKDGQEFTVGMQEVARKDQPQRGAAGYDVRDSKS